MSSLSIVVVAVPPLLVLGTCSVVTMVITNDVLLTKAVVEDVTAEWDDKEVAASGNTTGDERGFMGMGADADTDGS